MMAKERKHYQHTRISNGNKSKSKFPIFFHNMQRRKSECLSNHKKNEAHTKESGTVEETKREKKLFIIRNNYADHRCFGLSFRSMLSSTGILERNKNRDDFSFLLQLCLYACTPLAVIEHYARIKRL